MSAEHPDVRSVCVLLLCRVRLYREPIIRALNRYPGVRAIGSDRSGDGVLAELEELRPDAVLLDTGHEGALALGAFIVRSRPGTRILGFGVENSPGRVIACAEAGLCGYVPADATVAELCKAARCVAEGGVICSSDMADSLFRHLGDAARSGVRKEVDAALTPRQQQILRLIREGLSNKEIAQRLSLGASTVKNHVHSLLGRLKVGRRAEAVARLQAEAPPPL